MAKSIYPEFTAEEIDAIVKESTEYNTGGLAAMRPPFYEGLAGKSLTLRYDNGVTLYYEFEDAHTLRWKNSEAGSSHAEYYEALTADDNVIFFVHTVAGTSPRQARMTVLETDTRLVTTFFAKIGNEISTREVDRDIVFGYIEGGEAPEVRHSLTTELVGRSIVWTYSPSFSIQHIYASKWYSAFVDFNTFYGGMLLSSPCNYVKINDHVYIYSWVETEGAGIQGFALMNLFDMHDVGCFFGINGSGRFECYTFGAIGEYVGQLTNLDIPNDQGIDYPWPPMPIGEGSRE
ncbi:MAG: molybdenum cofactor biosynthesis F family protein [Clostridiales bacterium]|nr:molybdenum cofactor biosynthesis F family protein [Clostridiales bacterium]